MSKKPKKEKPNYLYLVYREECHGGEVCAGQENDSWPNHEPSYTEFEPTILTRKPTDWCHEIEVTKDLLSAEKLYMLVVLYQSGGTFGCSHGNWKVLGLFQTIEEAEAEQKKVSSPDFKGYKPWEGYFERLESFDIHALSVVDKCEANIKEYRYFDHTRG